MGPTAVGTRTIAVPATLAFGFVPLGESATKTLHVTNTGTADLTWKEVTSSHGAFTASPATGTVPAGQTRALAVTFTPDAGGTVTATVTVTSDATSGESSATVSGYSTTRGIGVSGNLAFGEVTVGQSAMATLTVSNEGNSELAFEGVSSTDAAFSASPASGTVPAGGSRPITVTFTPRFVAAYDATITVASNATGGANTISASGVGVAAPPPPAPPPPAPAGFTVTSSSFADGAVIPARYALCPAGSANVSPALAWRNAPANTQSFAVIVDDPTARDWTHWVLFNIPVSVTSIAEGGTAGTAGANDFTGGRAAYDGPCPPVTQGPHTYNFTVYALSVAFINAAPGAPRAAVQAAFAPYVIASAKVSGTYHQ